MRKQTYISLKINSRKKLSFLKNESRNKIVHRNSARTQKEAGKGSIWLIIKERCTSVVDAGVKQEKLSFLMLINECDGFFLGDYASFFNLFACLAFSLNVS